MSGENSPKNDIEGAASNRDADGQKEPNKALEKAADKTAKSIRKAEKKKAKEEKKALKSVETVPQSTAPDAHPAGTSSTMTPAERSAAAAEKQVELQKRRVWIAALTMLVALATLLVALDFVSCQSKPVNPAVSTRQPAVSPNE